MKLLQKHKRLIISYLLFYFRFMRFLLFILFVSVCQFSFSADSLNCYVPDASRYREHNVDFEKLVLEVSFAPKEGTVFGKTHYTFKPIQPNVDTLFLDAPNIKIDAVKMDGSLLKWQSNEEGVTIFFNKELDWDKSYEIDITYSAQPRKGLYFIGWNDPKNISRKQIWSQGQGIDNRHWFPSYDDVNDRLITETIIAFDSAYTVVSNGKLLSKNSNDKGEFVWHYAMSKAHAPYLLMLAIDQYAFKDDTANNGIVTRQYYYADRPETYAPTYQYSKELMDWMSEELGMVYPWETYANMPVQDFMYGAMENTTATVYTDYYLQDARQALEHRYISTNAHELTHQWFGNLLTEWSATHHWLHENFATYYAKLFMQKIFGDDTYEWIRRNEYEQGINADNSNHFPIAHSNAGSARHYPKGSAVLGMLRYVTGDAIYRKAIRHYLEKHQLGNVDTHDFWRAFMECCGVNLDWVFDEWILHSGYPIFEITEDKSNKNSIRFYVKQTQAPNESGKLFTMPVSMSVYFADNSFVTQKKLLTGIDTFSFELPKKAKIAYVLFDEGDHVLKKVVFEKSFEQLQAQVLSAKHFIDRYDAVYAMRNIAVETKSDFLIALFDKHNYFPIQQEIIYQLKTVTNDAFYTVLKKAITDKNTEVRRAAITYMDVIPDTLLKDYEKLLQDSSYVTIENTLRKLCEQFPMQKQKFLHLTKNVEGASKNVEIAWLEIQARNNLDLKYTSKLVEYTSNSYEFRTRLKAMEALKRIDFSNDALADNLIDAALNPNKRLANPAANYIRYFIKRDKFKELYQLKVAVKDYPEWAVKILDEIK